MMRLRARLAAPLARGTCDRGPFHLYIRAWRGFLSGFWANHCMN